MAVWQITDKLRLPMVDPLNAQSAWLHDDRQTAQPGDDGFTTEPIAAFVAAAGKGAADFNYVGQSPDLHADQIAARQAAAANAAAAAAAKPQT